MKQIILSLLLLFAFSACSKDDDNNQKDTTYPVISSDGIVANPIDCQQYKRGEVIAFNYLFTDNQELGDYTLEIHHNFDHHTSSTTIIDCPLDEKKTAQNPWVYMESFNIPAGQRSYVAHVNIDIPTDIDTGDYHFMIRLLDKEGWQQIHAVSIKIIE